MPTILDRARSALFRPQAGPSRCIRCGRSPDIVRSAIGPGVSVCVDCISALEGGEFEESAAPRDPGQRCSFCRRSGPETLLLYHGPHGTICRRCLEFGLEAAPA